VLPSDVKADAKLLLTVQSVAAATATASSQAFIKAVSLIRLKERFT